MVVKTQQGFSLIEIMIVVSLMVLLTTMTVPLAGAWIANSRIADAENKIRQGYKKVISLAIRNASASSGTAASLNYNNTTNTITIVKNGSAAVLWKAQYHSDTSIAIGSCTTQVNYDNNGFPTNSACQSYTISAPGGTSATGTLP